MEDDMIKRSSLAFNRSLLGGLDLIALLAEVLGIPRNNNAERIDCFNYLLKTMHYINLEQHNQNEFNLIKYPIPLMHILIHYNSMNIKHYTESHH